MSTRRLLHGLVEAQAARDPEAIAAVCAGEALTYGALDRRAARLARRLRRHGVGPEIPVGICVERSFEMLVGLLGILKAGGAYLPLDPAYPPALLDYLVADSNVPVILTHSATASRLPASCARRLVMDDEHDAGESDGDEDPTRGLHPDNLAYVIYTSGSTGRPKGVMVAHRSVCNHLKWMQTRWPLTPADRVPLKYSFAFDASICELFAPLVAGARVVIVRPGGQSDVRHLVRLCIEAQVTTLDLVPPLLDALLDEPDFAGLTSLRRVTCGGEALPPSTAERLLQLFDCELVNSYGPTETTIGSLEQACVRGRRQDVIPIGRPIRNTRAYILDEHLKPVAPEAAGELFIGGDGVARGYLHRPELTAARFVPDSLSATAGGRLYATGDRARLLPDGSIQYLGRRDGQVKVRGFRVELTEIEARLAECPGVKSCVVIARADATRAQRLLAYFTDSGTGLEPATLREHLAASLPQHMLPAAFVRLESLPLGPSGKLDREALPDPESSAYVTRGYEAPRAGLEATLAAIWSELLAVERVGRNDHFFELGGHSLLAVRVCSRLRQALGVEGTPGDIFNWPKLADLARHLESAAPTLAPALGPAAGEERLALSFAQQRLWFLCQMEGLSRAYHVSLGLSLCGELDRAALGNALDQLVARHEALRTTFGESDGIPRQRIAAAEASYFHLLEHDLRRHPDAAAELGRLLAAEARAPFDLGRGPLIRGRLIRTAEREHALLITMHHIVSDGWSMGVLVDELSALYAAGTRGEPHHLPPLAIQYADYGAWQRRWLSGDLLRSQADYWRGALAGVPELLEIPSDRPRPARQDYLGGRVPFEVDPRLTHDLKGLSQRRGTTLFMTLLAGWGILLSRLSGQDDFVVGTPIANRGRTEIEGLIGFFANTLALRLDLSGAPTVAELLARVKALALAAQHHQDIPFEHVVELVRPARSPAYSPLFQVMFAWQNNVEGTLDMPGLTLTTLAEPPDVTAKFDLLLSLSESGEVIRGSLEFAAALFDRSTAERHLGHLRTVLRAMVADDAQTIDRLSLLTPEELRQVVETWNASEVEAPGELCVHELFEAQVERTPRAVALVHAGQALTYRELNERGNRLAHHLKQVGVGPDARAALCAERSPEMIIGLLAVLKAGGAYVPLDPTLPVERLQAMLEDCAPAVLLAQGQLQHLFADFAGPRVDLAAATRSDELPAAANPDSKGQGRSAEQLAYVLYTSGSTGRPKGVAMPHRALVNLLSWQIDRSPQPVGAATLQFASLGFDVSFQEIFSTLGAGGKLVLIDEAIRLDPQALVEFIERERIRRLFLPFVALGLVAEGYAQASEEQGTGRVLACPLEEIITAGEQLRIEPRIAKLLQSFPNCRLENQYGPTETHVVTCYRLASEAGRWPHLPPIGRPIPSARIYVLDAHGRPVPIGVAGEIHVGGTAVARGYWNRSELTAERFLADPFSTRPAARMYRTGDLGRWLPDGNLEFLGRNDLQVKVRGFRVEPGEIEARLAEYPGVSECVVVARADGTGSRRLLAYFASSRGPLAPEALRAHLLERLPEYMLPAAFVQLEALPLTPNGKVNRKSLPDPDADAYVTCGYEAPRGRFESALAAIWSDLLGVERVGRNDDFFHLGGHSLVAVRVISRVRQALAVEGRLSDLFARPRLADFARSLEGAPVRLPPITPAAGGDRLALSFAEQRLWFLCQMAAVSAAYHVPIGFSLSGELDCAALRAALDGLVARHETLRTTFHRSDGSPVQCIAPADESRFLLLEHDLRRHPDTAAELARLVASEAASPFDLSQGPLIRGRLIRTADDEHTLLITMHHIVCDGWSTQVLLEELCVLYSACLRGEANPLPALAVQYADYGAWQRRSLSGDLLRTQADYWRAALAGAPELLEIPGDRPRPPQQDFAGDFIPFALDLQLSRDLRALSLRHGTTVFMTLLAGWGTLLSRLSGQEDVVVGTPTANRGRAEVEGLIGFFVNTLALRLDLSGAPTVAGLLARVKALTLSAQQHQDVPFEHVVEITRPARSLAHSPVFQVMFDWQNIRERSLDLPGLTLAPLPEAPNVTAKFDLLLSLSESGDSIAGGLEYASALFDRATVERYIGYFTTLLQAMVRDDTRTVDRLPLMAPAELHQVVGTWSASGPAIPRELCLHELFEARVESTPQALALLHEDQQLTYGELNARANQLAHHLRSLGVGPDARVALCAERSPEMVIALLAVLKAGGAYVPLDPAYPVDRLGYMLADSSPLAVLVQRDRGVFRDLALTLPAIDLLDGAPAWAGQPRTNPGRLGLAPHHLAYVIYTSGSSGRPKGVMVTQQGVVNYALWAIEAYQVADGCGAPVHSSIAFDLTVTSLLVPLLAGSTVTLLREPAGAEQLGEALARQTTPFSLVKITPAHLELLSRQLGPRDSAARTRFMVIGGEALRAEQVEHWRRHAPDTRLINEYGPTETVVGCAVHTVGDASPRTGGVPIGRPIANTTLYVLDRHQNPVPVGVAGELYIGGAGVARGYLNRPALTAERFVPDPFGAGGDARLYRSGDLARWRSDGSLEFLGRRDAQVKVRGFRVELGEIEAVLAGLPQVREAAVMVREDVPGDRRLVAYVVPSDGRVDPQQADLLRESLRTCLPEYMVPSACVLLARFPLTVNGKVDRSAFPAPAGGAGSSRAPAGPLAAGVEEQIGAIWRRVLGLEQLGAHDNFFDLGGHSLLLIRVHEELGRIFDARLTLTDLFRYPTIHALAAFLERDEARAQVAEPAPPRAPMAASEAVAIVGMACRFPGAANAEELWANVRAGLDAVREFSDEEMLADGADPESLADPNYVRRGPVLEGIDLFDAGFFDFSAREAEILDPQQRLFLECAWEALEHAACDAERHPGPIGVFAGAAASSYLTQNLLASPEILRAAGEYQVTLSTDKDFLPTRTSYKLNLRGPSVSANTACSTSLVAVHLARQSLLAGECDVALAGGVTVVAAQRRGYLYETGGIESPDGHCRPFDAGAQGTIGSSGVGIVVLKRLSDALAAGDTVHAVIKGTAINNDGAAKVGYTAPSVDGQAAVIARALAVAGVSPQSIGYVEAHGTGTLLGDPIEVAALTQAFGSNGDGRSFCALGSVKSNIGHTDAAAGVAGLIKAVMALKHATLPPTVHFRTPNPKINFDHSPFYVNGECRDWPANGVPRRAGVSAFGIGGTNAHVVLEEAPSAATVEPGAARRQQLLLLSAKTAGALEAQTERLRQFLVAHPDVRLGDVAATLQLGRRALSHRRVLVCTDADDAAAALAARRPGRLLSGVHDLRAREVAFLFPGQGAQYVHMSAGLYGEERAYRTLVDECSETLRPLLGLDLRAVLFPAAERADEAAALLQQTWLTQPALFTVEYALARLLMSWGFRPRALLGHSIGEYVAACLAGVFVLEDALRLVAERGRLMQQLPEGAMLAVSLGEDELRPWLGAELSLAAINAPALCVVAGPGAAVDRLQQGLRGREITCRALRTSHAFHSAMMDPIVAPFAAEVARLSLKPPTLPYLSNVTGTWATTAEATDPEYWARHLRATVRFAENVHALSERGEVLVEVGPGQTLGTFVRSSGRHAAPPVVRSLRSSQEARDDSAFLLEAVGKLWLEGVPIDWERMCADERRGRLPLPTYPFERRRYWVDRRPASPALAHSPALPPSRVAAPEAPATPAPFAASAHPRPDLHVPFVAPQGSVEAQVASIWTELLGIAPVGRDDSFFDLGGHSLLATQLLSRLRAHFRVELPLETIFEAPTVAGVATALGAASVGEAAAQLGAAGDERAEPVALPRLVARERRADPLPLSFGQQRLWFLDQAHPGNAAYTIAVSLRLRGRLDEAALKRAIEEMVRRHEALRTVFPASEGDPVQVILPPGPVDLRLVDLQAEAAEEREGLAARTVFEEAGRPFDLRVGPVFRPVLIRISRDEHLLLLSMHHIVSDGWSISVINREVSRLYSACVEAEPAPLPELAVQYADFALWQREVLQGQHLAGEIAYWKRQLEGAAPGLDLPTDRPRPPVQTFDGAGCSRRLGRELSERLYALSRREGVTLYMTILAAFQALLFRYTGQTDISVGCPIAGRTRAELEGLIGFFLNTLVLRTRLSGEMTFDALLKQVRETALGAYAHQDVPFERLVAELAPVRDLSRNPLFQAMFVLLNLPKDELRMTGLEVTRVPVENGTSQVDLALYVYEREEGLECCLEYNTHLFDAPTVERMLGHLETLLAALAQSTRVRLAQLPLLTPAECHRQTVEWNPTRVASGAGGTLPELVQAQVGKTPAAPAILFGTRTLTYREMNRRSNRLARRLRALGVGRDVLVGVQLGRSELLPVALLAVMKAGGAYVPLDPLYPPDRRAHILDDSRAAVVITEASLRDSLGGYGGQVILIESEQDEPGPQDDGVVTAPADPDDLAYVLYTSGSTGRPKGVRVRQSAVVNLFQSMCREPGLTDADTLLSVSTFAFDISVLELFLPLTVGARVVLADSDSAYDGMRLMALLERHAATVMQATPATWRMLVEAGWRGTPGLRALCGGEALGAGLAGQLLERVAALWNLYGPTETTIYSTGCRVERADDVTIGRPIANTAAYVLDPYFQLLPVGVIGELFIGGPGLARDYNGRPDLTAERFVPDPFGSQPGARLYRTGDLARLRPDGVIEYLGRNDSQVKLRGYRIELGEIEARLRQHPAAAEAVVALREDVPGEARLVAYVVPRAGQAAPTVGEWRAFLKRDLPDYMIPTLFVEMRALPLTPNGKVNRRALPVPEITQAPTGVARVAPRTALEQTLTAHWSQVLGIGELGIDDSFFDLGGDSFKALRAVRAPGVSAGVMDLFRHPTVRAFAAHLQSGYRAEQGLLHDLTPGRAAGTVELTLVCVPFAGGGAITFQPLAAALPQNLALYALQPPGHDVSRADEARLPMAELVRRTAVEIRQRVKGPLVLYGHCMGGALTMALALQLEADGFDLVQVIIGGHFPAPRLPGRLFDLVHRWFPMERWTSKRQALDFLRAMGFFTEVRDPREQEFIIRAFMHDTREGEEFYSRAYAETDRGRLQAPLLCVIGERDRATELYQERYREWTHFARSVSLEVIRGAGHYFQKHQARELAEIIAARGSARRDQATAKPAVEAQPDVALDPIALVPPAAAPSWPQRKAPVVRPRSPAAEPSLRVFFLVALGQFVSLIGTGLTAFAMGVSVYQQTHSMSRFALISVMALLPALLCAPIAGAIADRWDKRRIMIWSDSLAACGTLALALLLWTHSLQLWHIYVVVTIGAISNSFQLPAYLAAITQLVPKRYYGRANGITELGVAAGTILAPLVGGALAVWIGFHGIVLIDLATFVFAITITLSVRFPDALFVRREEPFWQEVAGGWRYISRRPGLTAIILFTMVLNLFFGMVEVTATPLTLALGRPTTLGLVLAATGVGLLSGSALMSIWGGLARRTDGILGCYLLIGASMVITGLRPQPAFPALGLFGLGLGTAILNAHWLSIVQAKVGLELQGRVIATTQMLSWLMVPLGFLSAGPIAERLLEPLMSVNGPLRGSLGLLIGVGPGRGMALLMIIAGLLTILLGWRGFRYRPVRFLEDALPDAIPDALIPAEKDVLQAEADRRLGNDLVRSTREVRG